MKLIQKTKKEPSYLLQHRKKNKKNNYDSFCKENTSIKDIVTKKRKVVSLYSQYKKHLLNEQGFICAYCMKRIPNKQAYFSDKKTKEIKEKENLKLEHWYPQHGERTNSEQIDIKHSNIIAVCTGNMGLAKIKNHQNKRRVRAKQVETCDTSRNEGDFLIVNPQNTKHIELIKYSADGSIFAFEMDVTDQEIVKKEYLRTLYKTLIETKGIIDNKLDKDGEIVNSYKKLKESTLVENSELLLTIHYDLTVILNLNETDLILQREAIYRAVSKRTREILKNRCRSRAEKNEYLTSEIENWLSRRKGNRFEPFCMVAVFYLKSKLRYPI